MTGVLRARVGGAWVDVVGSGSDEVVIGPDDPIATVPSTELWYDTDDDYSAGLAPTAVAGNALGLIAIGYFNNQTNISTGAVNTRITSASVACTLFSGRRYRVSAYIRAWGNGVATGSGLALAFWDNGSNTTWIDGWNNVVGNYAHCYVEAIVNGDGANHSLDLYSTNCTGTAVNVYGGGGGLMVEDLGPNQAPALPVPTTYQSWTQVTTFSNSWVNYGAPYPPAMYRRVGDIVDIRGLIKAGTVNVSGGCFTLPAGFRPAWQQWFPTSAFDAFGQTIVYPSGEVRPSVGNNTWFDLGTISFSVTG